MGLAAYRAQRNFNSTAEPRGLRGRRRQGVASFVVQKHAASHLHYDFRLEIDGALKSWAMPKGPSLDPRIKRLAVHVEDHPLEYATFEGAIPAPGYGAGTVIVWDRGTWMPKGDAPANYRKGRLEFELQGEKLKGMWALVRIRGKGATAKQDPWLLIKQRDAYATTGKATDITVLRPESVKTGNLIDPLAEAPEQRGVPTQRKAVPTRDARTAQLLPRTMQPQLATLVSAAPREGRWLYEIKFDGYRILARISESSVALYSRTGKDWTERMPDIAHALRQLKTKSAWLDGEVVALDAEGRSDFQRLQNSFEDKQNAALTFCMFDLPYADGQDLRDEQLLARKARLELLLAGVKSPNLAFSRHTAGDGATLLAAACKRGLEGLIAKLATSTYRSARTRTWLKLKCKQRQEFVVGGYTDPGGSRTGFGALLLGVQERGALRYVGKVGTGFDSARLDSLAQKFKSLRRTTAPFVNPPRGAAASAAHWLEPSLVAEVSFAQWTEDGVLRQAVFHGLREDKAASDVKPERIATARVDRGRQGTTAGSVRITHPDRIIFPAAALTKGALAAYYAEAADRILPHLRDRPLSLLRCPDGVGKACFYQKHALPGVADVLIVEIEEKDGEAPYMIANSANALLGLVQMGTVELHTWGATRQQLERPDRIIFDLDPDPALEWRYVVEAAGLVRTVLDQLGLRAFVKTTGGKGLHVVAPITRRHTWEAAKEFSRGVAEHIAATVPQRFTANMAKARRKGKIFIDFHRNERGATAVAAYSVRANPAATVSVPLAWEELDVKLQSTHFTLQNISRRLAARPDPWHEYWSIKQSLTPAMTRKLAGATRS